MSHHESIIYSNYFKFSVSYDYYPASRGAREKGTGVPLEPDEPATCEVCQVKMYHPTDEEIKPVDVTAQLSKPMLDYFDEQIRENHDDRPDDND